MTHSIEGVRLDWTSANSDSKTKEIRWADVVEAVAYKRDCFAFDLICVALVGRENALEITEEMEGWDELLIHLAEYLPRCRSTDSWYQEVMLPPFKENRTPIFSRREAGIRR